ncbi:uncharacterized protein IUM83_17148 [Phytophthora cinnamomi]|uniref:uncharacterized protein n=1 Tax=Phytophthora cinnamomi TaxID=4785 RepID=UPI00355A11B2|nr:hypothetical protein IUM83_17148 [Phytophthora cinnamomi]
MIFVGGHGVLNQVVDALLKSAVPSQKAIVPASKAASIQIFVATPGLGRQRPPLQNGNYAEKKINRKCRAAGFLQRGKEPEKCCDFRNYLYVK